MYLLNIRAGIQYKVQVGMHIQFRFKSVFASAQSDQFYFFRPKKRVEPLTIHIVPIEDSDQPAHARSLIRVFDGRTCQHVPLTGYRLKVMFYLFQCFLECSVNKHQVYHLFRRMSLGVLGACLLTRILTVECTAFMS